MPHPPDAALRLLPRWAWEIAFNPGADAACAGNLLAVPSGDVTPAESLPCPCRHHAEMLAKQRAALEGEVKRYTTGHVVHPGLPHWKEGGGPMPVGDIPGVQAGSTHET